MESSRPLSFKLASCFATQLGKNWNEGVPSVELCPSYRFYQAGSTMQGVHAGTVRLETMGGHSSAPGSPSLLHAIIRTRVWATMSCIYTVAAATRFRFLF